MVYFKRLSDVPYVITVETTDASKVANKEKFFPKEWVNHARNDITTEAIKYFLPLIQGEVKIAMKNGMPVHFKLK